MLAYNLSQEDICDITVSWSCILIIQRQKQINGTTEMISYAKPVKAVKDVLNIKFYMKHPSIPIHKLVKSIYQTL